MDISVVSDNIVSPLGFTTEENFENLTKSISGIKLHENKQLSASSFFAAYIDEKKLAERFVGESEKYSKLEIMFIISISEALEKSNVDIQNKETLLIFSSTKGNIDLLESNPFGDSSRIHLWRMAEVVADFFGCGNVPLIVSNACISGSMAIITANRLLKAGRYKNIVIAGGDIISKFTIAGFQAFKAMSASPCKPFDEKRDGITLGEGCGTIILTSDSLESKSIKVLGGAITNDANHISGPSRTGEGLFLAINNSLRDAKVSASDIDYISAHGTGTLFNDEMESQAIERSNLNHAFVNGLKGFYGHTLGAAGVIESIISIQSLKQNHVIATHGYKNLGVSGNLKIVEKSTSQSINYCLKTSSGFGGCNASIIFTNNQN
ncbi:MAG TPA: beta-ketoacyl-[acyl-carrier-protein] synthase family protein [Cytophagaceae bacterium]|jgi:3-oxoacyl-[acyl-carrier-protein] synthase-1